MNQTQYTFFGAHRAMEALSQEGDRLVELERHIDRAPLIRHGRINLAGQRRK